jgi:hypothetical protein
MSDGEGEGTPRPSGEPVPAPTEPGAGIERASLLSRRALGVLVAALFAFGSCGVALGLYQLSKSDDGGLPPAPSPPIPAPSASSTPSPSESPSPTGAPAADLVVTEITAASVTVTNVGDAPAGRFVVSVGGTAFIVEDGLEPGGGVLFDFKCRQGPFTAEADSTDRVEESDETNNARTAGPFDCASPSPSESPSPTVTPSPTQTTPPPALPDLVVQSVSSDRVTVANIGSGSAGGFVVDVGPAGTFSIGGLAAGRSATVTFPCTDGTFTATADSSGRVRESNERNNSRSGGPFQCLPDLIVSSLGLDSVTIANIGRGDAGPSIVTVGGQALSVPALGAGEKVQLSYQCVGGDVTAFADAQQQVAESNEGNNQRSASVGQCGVP